MYRRYIQYSAHAPKDAVSAVCIEGTVHTVQYSMYVTIYIYTTVLYVYVCRNIHVYIIVYDILKISFVESSVQYPVQYRVSCSTDINHHYAAQ